VTLAGFWDNNTIMIQPASAGFFILERLEIGLEIENFVTKKGLMISHKPLILFGSP
jgi:hypothetical protein